MEVIVSVATKNCETCGKPIKQRKIGGRRKRCEDCVIKLRYEKLQKFLLNAPIENERVGFIKDR